MSITKHAMERARERLPRASSLPDRELEKFIKMLLSMAEMLNHAQIASRFPNLPIRGEATYFVLGTLVFPVRAGNVITVIDMKVTRDRRLLSYA